MVHARDAVVVTEYDASGEPRIVLVNPAFTAQTGYPSDEVVGRKVNVFRGLVQAQDSVTQRERRLRGDPPDSHMHPGRMPLDEDGP